MAVRTEVQKRVTEMVLAGTFYKVTYVDKIPTETTTTLSPSSVVMNETNSGLSTLVADTGGCSHAPVQKNWRFELVAAFDSEVSVDYFFENEFKKLYFTYEGLLVNVVATGDYNVTHPPRNDSHNGTKLTLGLTVNTRR